MWKWQLNFIADQWSIYNINCVYEYIYTLDKIEKLTKDKYNIFEII